VATAYQIKIKGVLKMSMVRNFKSAKVQLTLIGDKHPKGVTHLFNNVIERVTDEQLTSLTQAIEILTSEKCNGANVIATDHVAID
jgi:DNA gyrase/topoisomerase IV subunit B